MVCNGGEYQYYHIGSPRIVGLTYMVRIILLNLRSQETDKGVPHARAAADRSLRERLSIGEPLALGTRDQDHFAQRSERAGAFETLAVRDLARGSAIRFLRSVYATAQNIREAGQGSGLSERMRGYDQFISLLFCVLQIIYVSYIHLCCFICTHEFISSALSYYNMLHLLVLILQSCYLCCYLLIFQLFSQFICLSYLYDSYNLCSHDPYYYGYI
jgi:hypothetical protein